MATTKKFRLVIGCLDNSDKVRLVFEGSGSVEYAFVN